jgi:hypothetical protein
MRAPARAAERAARGLDADAAQAVCGFSKRNFRLRAREGGLPRIIWNRDDADQ